MELRKRSILVLGGAGLVGLAICRRLLEEQPGRLVVTARSRASAERAVAALTPDAPAETVLEARWGNVFVPWNCKDRSRDEILADPELRRAVLRDLLDPLAGDRGQEILESSTLARMIREVGPDAIVDCINTATAIAYQDLQRSAGALLGALAGPSEAIAEAVERHLLKLYVPQLARHVQILHQALLPRSGEPGVQAYLKVGTSGTGGMGLDVPYTHGEEKPSSALLAKAAVAGAHSLLLFLLARTRPEQLAVKELKPAAAIAWADVGTGPVMHHGRPIPLYDCPPEKAYVLAEATAGPGPFGTALDGRVLENVFIDTGENGLFALGEFSALTALGQMAFVTPEEIAENAVRELKGAATGRDVIAALDQAVMGPSYRAGVLRAAAILRMRRLEEASGVRSVAFEALGPPRLSKLLFEAELLRRASGDSLRQAARCAAATLARSCSDAVARDQELRSQMISIGIPVLLPDGDRLLRGPTLLTTDPEAGWVDLRPANMERWKVRLARLLDATHSDLERNRGSSGTRLDLPFADPATGRPRDDFDIGGIAGWILASEEGGVRRKA